MPGKGFALYHVERIIRETGEVFDDGSHIIYVNGEYTGNDEIGNLIHDFHCVKADDIYNPELANSIRHYKEEGENNMCSSVKAYGDIRAAEAEARGRAEGRAETAKEYQSALAERDAENARLRAELEKYKSAEKRNWTNVINYASEHSEALTISVLYQMATQNVDRGVVVSMQMTLMLTFLKECYIL